MAKELRFVIVILTILTMSLVVYVSSSTVAITSVGILAVYSAIFHFPIWLFYLSGFQTSTLTWIGSTILLSGAVAVGVLIGADIDQSSTAGLGFAFLPYYICLPPLALVYGVWKVFSRQDLK